MRGLTRSERYGALALAAVMAACGGDPEARAPGAPAGVTATAVSAYSVVLAWEPASPGDGVAGYHVMRGGQDRAETPETGYLDEGLDPSMEYCYRVLAQDAEGRHSPPSEEACATTPGAPVLTVGWSGVGSGAITGPGIACPGDCSEVFAKDDEVVLVAAAAAGSTFDGWTGCDAVNGASCTVTMDTHRSVVAAFGIVSPPPPPPSEPSLTVVAVQPGGGTYLLGGGTVTGYGIDCPGDCQEVFAGATEVTLTPLAWGKAAFGSWTGCDQTLSGSRCLVHVASARSVTARFVKLLTVSVKKDGTGAGTVRGSGVTCGLDCSGEYREGTWVYLVATPNAGSTFVRWSGCTPPFPRPAPYPFPDYPPPPNACPVFASGADHTVTATFDSGAPLPATFALGVVRSGAGAGSVTGPGIACPGDCSEVYESGEVVVLAASAAEGSTFQGWTGCDTAEGASCTVTMNANRTPEVAFGLAPPRPPAVTLTVVRSGAGVGTVTGPGIGCPDDCGEAYEEGEVVELAAAASEGSTFDGWTGCDAVNGASCTVTMVAHRSVVAAFGVVPPPPPTAPSLTVVVVQPSSGTAYLGGGRVTGTGIVCPGDCSEAYAEATTVSLTPTLWGVAVFGGWTGCDSLGPHGICTVRVASARTVTARFVRSQALTVVRSGTGSGTVTAGGINCGSDCTERYAEGQVVTLTATPDAGSAFVLWTGCTQVSGATCRVYVFGGSRTITALFDLAPP